MSEVEQALRDFLEEILPIDSDIPYIVHRVGMLLQNELGVYIGQTFRETSEEGAPAENWYP